MKTLEMIEVETEFTTGQDERGEADQRLLQATLNERLVQALHDARDEIAALPRRGRQACRAAVDLRRVPDRSRR